MALLIQAVSFYCGRCSAYSPSPPCIDRTLFAEVRDGA